MGYTKKDVDSFFDIVVMSYTELYKSNAELTNQVKTLTDSLVHYRTTESKLQKSLMLAEKNAEEATKNANDKAKIIENDAKIKANSFGMTDVKVSVRLGREARLHFSSIFTFFQIFLYCLLNKVQAFLFTCFFVFYICHNGKCVSSI